MARTDNRLTFTHRIINELSSVYGYLCVNMTEIHQDHLSKMFRDSYHTNIVGATKYAESIHQFLIKNPTLRVPKFDTISFLSPFENIKKFSINNSVLKYLNFTLRGFLVGMSQTIGPFSGIVVLTSEEYIEEFSIWDKWCHFERETIKICPLREFDGNVHLALKFIPSKEETATKLVLKDIFYTGELEDVQYE